MKPIFTWLLIILSTLALAWYYDYGQVVLKSPQSFHHWRQSDAASLTQNFHRKDLPFWEPEIHGLISDSGTTGKNAPSELAVYYWGVGQLYSFLGDDDSILRGINTGLFLLGICGFIYALFLITNKLLWSILLGLLLFTSPILVYYGNNFLTNAPSFGMALLALCAFTAFTKSAKPKHWWLTTLFFLLAGALKLPGLFLFFAIGAVVIFHPGLISGLRRRDYFISAAIILLPLLAWVIYANRYNASHNSVYFSTTIFPLWEFTRAELSFFVNEMRKMWWGEHFHPITFIGLGLLGLFLLTRFRKIPRHWLLIALYLFAGLIAYTVLQFYTFMSHDYYTINMFMLAALILVLASSFFKKTRPTWLSSPVALGIVGLVLIANAWYAKQRVEFRYTGFPNEFYAEHTLLYSNAEEWLRKTGVGRDDTIIFVADDSHTSLYLLNRYGWTTHKLAFKDTSKTIYFNRSEEGIRRSVENGAEYLLVHGLQNLYEKTHLQPFIRHLAGRNGDLFVFSLRDTSRNFRLPQRELLQRFRFNFENPDTVQEISSHLVRDSGFTGNFALKASAKDEFLAEIQLPQVSSGMLIEAEVWTKTHPDAKVLPVISSVTPDLAFQQKLEIVKEIKGWRLLRQQLLVTSAMEPEGVKVFLWNPEHYEVLFDDLEVRIYAPNPLEL